MRNILVCLLTIAPSLRASGDQLNLTLQDALKRAWVANLEVKRSARETQVSSLQLDSVRSSYLPTLSLEVKSGTARDRDMFTDETERPKNLRDHNYYHGDLVASYNLFRGFSDRNKTVAYESALEQSQVAASNVNARIAREVITTYFNVQLIQRKIKAEEEAKTLRANQLSEVRSRNRAGAATKLDVLQAEYALKSTEPQLHEFKNSLQLAILELQQLTQLDPKSSFVLKNTLEQAFASARSHKAPRLADLYQLALKKSFSLRDLRLEKSRLRADLESGQANNWPRIDLRFIAQTRAYTKDEVFDDEVRNWRGELAISLPLFNGLSSFADRSAIVEKLASLSLSIEIEQEKLLKELTDHFHRRELSYKQYESEKANLTLAEESIKQARDLYEAGSAKLTDVLDAYTQKFDAIKNAGQAMYDHIAATAWLQFYTDSLPSRLEEKS